MVSICRQPRPPRSNHRWSSPPTAARSRSSAVRTTCSCPNAAPAASSPRSRASCSSPTPRGSRRAMTDDDRAHRGGRAPDRGRAGRPRRVRRHRQGSVRGLLQRDLEPGAVAPAPLPVRPGLPAGVGRRDAPHLGGLPRGEPHVRRARWRPRHDRHPVLPDPGLPARARARVPARDASRDARIAHFTHTPFAGPTYVRLLPERMREELLRGMLGADVLGFQADRWAENFLLCVRETLDGVRVDIRAASDRDRRAPRARALLPDRAGPRRRCDGPPPRPR